MTAGGRLAACRWSGAVVFPGARRVSYCLEALMVLTAIAGVFRHSFAGVFDPDDGAMTAKQLQLVVVWALSRSLAVPVTVSFWSAVIPGLVRNSLVPADILWTSVTLNLGFLQVPLAAAAALTLYRHSCVVAIAVQTSEIAMYSSMGAVFLSICFNMAQLDLRTRQTRGARPVLSAERGMRHRVPGGCFVLG